MIISTPHEELYQQALVKSTYHLLEQEIPVRALQPEAIDVVTGF